MFCYDRGRGQPLLLIHGMFGDYRDWEPVLTPLAEHYRVIAVDLPGFGQSAAGPLRHHAQVTPAFFTIALTDLLDQLGIGAAAVAGNSFGAQIAMSLALAHPARVTKLILVGAGGLRRFAKWQEYAALWTHSERNLRRLTPASNAAMFSSVFFRQNTDNQRRYIEKQNARLADPDYAAYIPFVRHCMRLSIRVYLRDRAPELRMPVLLIQGERDPVVNADWVRAAQPLFPRARLVMFPECGHMPQLEQPERFIQEVEAFLGSSESTSA